MPLFLPLLVAALSASYTVNIIEIDGWPQLEITEHVMREFPAACPADAAGCAVVKLEEGTCDVYLSPSWPLQTALREHELAHCRGHDHMPFNLRAAHEAWVAAGRPHRPATPSAPLAQAAPAPAAADTAADLP